MHDLGIDIVDCCLVKRVLLAGKRDAFAHASVSCEKDKTAAFFCYAFLVHFACKSHYFCFKCLNVVCLQIIGLE